jgi:hypothetical protein
LSRDDMIDPKQIGGRLQTPQTPTTNTTNTTNTLKRGYWGQFC